MINTDKISHIRHHRHSLEERPIGALYHELSVYLLPCSSSGSGNSEALTHPWTSKTDFPFVTSGF